MSAKFPVGGGGRVGRGYDHLADSLERLSSVSFLYLQCFCKKLLFYDDFLIQHRFEQFKSLLKRVIKHSLASKLRGPILLPNPILLLYQVSRCHST